MSLRQKTHVLIQYLFHRCFFSCKENSRTSNQHQSIIEIHTCITCIRCLRCFSCIHADFTDPITAGIFVSIAAWASYQRSENKTPYWRTLKANGELNAKYPGGIEAQKEKLESEGHTIIQKGRKNIRYYVKDYQNFLSKLTTVN